MKKKLVLSMSAIVLIVCITVGIWLLVGGRKTITPIIFDEELSFSPSLPEVIENQIPQETIDAVFGKEINLYKIVSRRINGYDEDLLEKFQMENYIVSDDPEDYITTYKTADKRLRIYNDGSFTFSLTRISVDEPLTVSFDELKVMAEEYLESKDLLPENFYQQGYTKSEVSSGGETIVPRMGPSFVRKIDGYTVYGSSFIDTDYDNQGLRSIYSIYSDYVFDRVAQTISFEDAYSLMLGRGKHVQNSYKEQLSGEVDKIILNNARLAYYDVGRKGTHILPCYILEGIAYAGEETTEFQSWVMAIPQSMTTR